MNTEGVKSISIQGVIAQGVELFKKYLFVLVAFSLVQAVISWWTDTNSDDPLMVTLLSLISLFLGFVVIAYIHHNEHGKKEDIQESFTYSLSRSLVVFATAILAFLAIFLGFILVIVPGIIFGVWFGQSFYFSLLEKKGPLESLSLSKKLTYGNRWKVLAVQFGALILYFALMLTSQSVFGLEGSLLVGLLPGALLVTLNYALWKALMNAHSQSSVQANPSVS